MNDSQRIYEGNRATEVLQNEVFQNVFAAIEKEMTEQWMNSPARDAEGREKMYMYLQMLKRVKIHLTTAMETGKLTCLELEHKKSLAQRLTSWSS